MGDFYSAEVAVDSEGLSSGDLLDSLVWMWIDGARSELSYERRVIVDEVDSHFAYIAELAELTPVQVADVLLCEKRTVLDLNGSTVEHLRVCADLVCLVRKVADHTPSERCRLALSFGASLLDVVHGNLGLAARVLDQPVLLPGRNGKRTIMEMLGAGDVEAARLAARIAVREIRAAEATNPLGDFATLSTAFTEALEAEFAGDPDLLVSK